jgi:hypothetical protein
MKSLCAVIGLTIGLTLGIPGAATAQMAQLEPGSGAPPSADGLSALGAPAEAVGSNASGSENVTQRQCEERARAFRARNTQSPSRRQQALENCLAVARLHEDVDVAGQ